jgi:hypothetical protein
MDKIYSISAVHGPIAYFSDFSEALAYWNYLQFGNGVNDPPCVAMGVDQSSIIMHEVQLFDRDNKDFMKLVHETNACRESRLKSRRILELQQASPVVHSGFDSQQRN